MKRIAVLITSMTGLFVMMWSLSALSVLVVHASQPADVASSPLWRLGGLRVEGIDALDVAATLSITDNLPATQGDFVTVPIIFNTGANSVTSVVFELHYDTSKLQLDLGPPSGGQREVLSVTFPNLPSIYEAGAWVVVGAESDIEFAIHIDPLIGTLPNPVPLIPNGVLANLTFRAIGIGPVTTPLTFETTDPPASAGLSSGSSLTMGVTVDSGSVVINPAVETINLVPGFNLIGMNIVPTVTTPSAVFAQLGSNLKTVHKKPDCTSPYQVYDPSIPPFLNTLTSVDIQHGYWVYVDVTSTLLVTGSVPTYPVTIPICVGFNLIGYPSKVNVTLPGALNASITGQWNKVFGEPFPFKVYDPTIPPFLNTLLNMGPHKGYWLDANTATTLTVGTGP